MLERGDRLKSEDRARDHVEIGFVTKKNKIKLSKPIPYVWDLVDFDGF